VNNASQITHTRQIDII